jgi:BirA family biotin operon repressor/biotin-[acetyl-CoA-carboxylase] ligase
MVAAFGRPHLHLRSTESTNDRARELAEAGAPSGAIVTADEQSAGRGRRGRVWSAPSGSALLFSAVLRPLALEHGLLPLATPIAACAAIESVAPVHTRVKWPNDVWIDESKVAGVLIEARFPDWAVIGIGVNVSIEPEQFPRDLRWPATSIGHGVAVDDLREALCRALDAWTTAPEAEILAEFRRRDALLGRRLAWEGGDPPAGSGTGAGVDERGHLVVEVDDGDRVALGSGEVSLRLAAE